MHVFFLDIVDNNPLYFHIYINLLYFIQTLNYSGRSSGSTSDSGNSKGSNACSNQKVSLDAALINVLSNKWKGMKFNCLK
jgi:hypothetical protein